MSGPSEVAIGLHDTRPLPDPSLTPAAEFQRRFTRGKNLFKNFTFLILLASFAQPKPSTTTSTRHAPTWIAKALTPVTDYLNCTLSWFRSKPEMLEKPMQTEEFLSINPCYGLQDSNTPGPAPHSPKRALKNLPKRKKPSRSVPLLQVDTIRTSRRAL